MTHYEYLKSAFAEVQSLQSVLSLLGWDMEVMMPQAAVENRGEQMASLERIIHSKITDPKIEEALSNAKCLDPWDTANLRSMKHIYDSYKAVPVDLLSRYAKHTAISVLKWREAREKKDWQMFKPHMEEMILLAKEIGQAKADYFGIPIYDAMMQTFDPGQTTANVDKYFKVLEKNLPGIIRKASEKYHNKPIKHIACPEDVQQKICLELMRDIGFDFNRGRLDKSTHPFCSGSYYDLRITTRYNEKDLTQAIFGVLHETGHAMYEQQLNTDLLSQPVGQSHGMSIHESQSLFIEMQVSQNPQYLKYLTSKLNGIATYEELLQSVHHVRPSFIRVEADEATYPMHVILRYNMEKALFSGNMTAAEIPDAWNEHMKEMLGITPPNPSLGCLQDIHWPSGTFGYFHTYSLGAMIAAQLMHHMRLDIPNLDEYLEKGDLKAALKWLKDKIHSKASLHFSAEDLVVNATNEGINPQYLLTHLRNRYISQAS